MERDAEFRGSPWDQRIPDRANTLEQALRDLRLTARVLLQNAEGCAVNHYGRDLELHGEPGWLRDSRLCIERAEALLPEFAKAPQPSENGVSDEEVVESCGCVFCDLDDVPEMINGTLKHHYQGRDGRLVPCTKQQ